MCSYKPATHELSVQLRQSYKARHEPLETSMTKTGNPLLSNDFAIPFDRIRPEHVEAAIRELLQEADAGLNAIEQAEGEPTYEGTLGAMERATEQLEIAQALIRHLESVASTPELREVHNAVRPDVSSFFAGIPLRSGLWNALQRFSETEAAQRLHGAQARHLERTLDDFRRSGAELDSSGKERLHQISREMAELTSKFSQNVLDDTAEFALIIGDARQLAGLPESARAAARADAEARGIEGWRFTLQAPSLIPVLTYLDSRDIRQKMWQAYNTRATSGERDNTKLITQILKLRGEQAQLLGYPDFAALVLEDRMAKHTSTAREFVKDLHDRTLPHFKKETEELQDFARAYQPNPVDELSPWDVGYFSEKRRKALFDFDEELLRPYFPVEAVLDGLFETAHRLYGIRIEPETRLPTWHEDVRTYRILDADGAHLASFYADLFPRDEKRGGAWMDSFISGVVHGDTMSPHLGLICANVTPPVGDEPAQLTHAEVTTMFHEFGHLLHHCLSRVEVRSLVGTNVAWDFVELPSQIMENWCWEKEALDTFARHFKTGELIPLELFEKMTRARTYRAASAMMRQLGFAAVDLAIHVEYDQETDGPLLPYARNVMQDYAPTPYPEDYGMLASFSHLFSSSIGYAAGYYSYKWAEVLDADAFTRFKREGVFSATTGDAFRRTVLERGNTEDPMELYRRFMGREPSLDALMERSGLSRAA
jgi:oligopeptidase A